MVDDDIVRMILSYVSETAGRPIRSMDTLLELGSADLLEVMEKLDDAVLPIFVSMFKSTRRGREFFHRLTENHDQETAAQSNAFLKRYMNLVLQNEGTGGYVNPLAVYLPAESLDDLAFVQSRQPFFLRQTIDTINEFLRDVCGCEETFDPCAQEEAWGWFWRYLLSR